MNNRKDIVIVENASVETTQGKWFVKYQTKKGWGQIDVLNIQDVSTVKQRHVWMLVTGLVPLLLMPIFITFPANYLGAGLFAILQVFGIGLLVCYAFPPSYVSVKHEGEEFRVKLRKKRQREAFVDEINQKKELVM